MVCVGDSFDDGAAASSLDPADAAWLADLGVGRRWTWITGNHDPGPHDLPGEHRPDLRHGPLVFRHIACAEGSPAGEVSGHFHPKFRRQVGGVPVARPCFVTDGVRLVLPAFGTFTGGLAVDDPALRRLFGPGVRAILAGRPCLALPLDPEPGRASAPARRNSLDAPGAPA